MIVRPSRILIVSKIKFSSGKDNNCSDCTKSYLRGSRGWLVCPGNKILYAQPIRFDCIVSRLIRKSDRPEVVRLLILTLI